MPDEGRLLSQLDRYLDGKTEEEVTESLEKLSFEVSQTSEEFGLQVLRTVLQRFSSSCHILLSWLLLYKVVDPLLILQVFILKKDTTIFSKCGTSQFASDVLSHLRIPKQEGANMRFEIEPTFSPISIDVLEYLEPNVQHRPRVEQPKRPAPRPYAETSQSAPALKKVKPDLVKPDLGAYEVKLRKNLKSSMSVEEAVHRLNAMYQKNTEFSVASTILRVACESKLYNRLHGNIATRLFKGNNRRWHGAWPKVFITFYSSQCEAVDADRLKVAGSFFGHLLSSNVLDWAESFEVIQLDAEHTTPSKRILFFALFEEMRVSLGTQVVERRILSPELRGSVDGLLNAELSSGFWEMAKFPMLAEHCSN